jgi:threonine/homoserine/homoserine lactone efflux protein
MPLQTLYAALVFSLVMGFTPGPNNIMLASSGASFGLRRTGPHWLGVTIGFPVMVLLVGVGLASLLLASVWLQLGMKIAASAYLLWLAFQIGRSHSISDATSGKPMSFLQAAAFQWINPKAWLIAVGAISAYTSGSGSRLYLQVAIIALISLLVCAATSMTWTLCGAIIRRWLHHPMALRTFNVAMALLLVASVVPIVMEIRADLARL